LLPPPRFDPDAARQLLVDAGYPNGRGLPELACLEVTPPGETASQGQWISRQLKEHLGIRLTPQEVSLAEILRHAQDDERQLWMVGWSADYTDPNAMMRGGAWPKMCNWPNRRFSQLVNAARIERDQEQRLEMYRQAEQLMADDVPLIPLIYGRWHVLVKPWVKRLATSATVWTIFKDVILDAGE
jgi:ABC-type oligopeptide transport system substrate-binding subunit